MRLKIDVEIPSWTKWLVGGIVLGIIVGLVGARVYADTISIKTNFANGETLSATDMNTNFQKLQDAVNQAAPAGTVVAFAGSTPPTGWLLCDGSAVSRTQYSELFAAISATYGIGDAATTFNLPDLRGAGIRGAGTSTKFISNVSVSQGQVVDDQLQGHTLGDGSRVLMRHVSSYGDNQDVGIGAVIHDSPTHVKSVLVSDGTNGTPRTGMETTGKAIGMNYVIKY